MDCRFGWKMEVLLLDFSCFMLLLLLLFSFFFFFLNSFRTDSIHAAQANLKHFSLLALAGTTGLHYRACLKDKL